MTQTFTTKPKRPLSVVIGGFLLVAWFIICFWGATQYVAHQFGYQKALGSTIYNNIYAPFDFVLWLFKFSKFAPNVFGRAEIGLALALAAGVLVFAILIGMTRSERINDGIHGTAHWATKKEIEQMGLLNNTSGVYIGGYTDKSNNLHYLRHNSPEHICVFAPTRSGKGVSLIVPTLLSWGESAVILDSKGELFNMTSGWRASGAGNRILRFDPAAKENSVSYNPLEEIRIGTDFEVKDAQNLAIILVDPDGKGLRDHWTKTAHALLVGVIIHEMYKVRRKENRTATLPEVAFALSDPTRTIESYYYEMLYNDWLADKGKECPNKFSEKTPAEEIDEWLLKNAKIINMTVATAARDMLNRPAEERGSVLSTAMSFLTLYRDPLVARNVSKSDFHLNELMNGEKPVSLYVVIRLEDKDRMRPLVRLLLNQIVRVLLRPEIEFVDGQPKSPHRRKLLLMLDEFPSYGRLDVFQESLAFIAGYGLKAYIICQDIAQLRSRETGYGHDETITANCGVRICFAPNNLDTANWVSGMTGTMTVIKEDISTSGKRFGGAMQNVSRSYHEVSRPLLTADEALRLKSPRKDNGDKIVEAGEVLVFVGGNAPIKGTQTLYFLDPTFSARARVQPTNGDIKATGFSDLPTFTGT